MKNPIILILMMSTVLLASCISCKEGTYTSVVSEEYAVYKAVIEFLYLNEDVELIVIKDRTAIDVSPGESLDNQLRYIQEEFGSAIDWKTIEDFRTKNSRSYQLSEDFYLNVPCVLLSEAALAEIFEQGGGWALFYRRYPNSQGIMTLSRVGFNARMDQALVYIGNQADSLAGRGYYVLLSKKGDAWSVDKMVIAWIS